MIFHLQNQCRGAAAAKSLQSCLTLCDPIDGSPSGSPIPGILQVRTLEWIAISFSNAWKWKVKVKALSCVLLFTTPWTAAHQAPPSMGFSRQEYWSGVPLPSPKFLLYRFKLYRFIINLTSAFLNLSLNWTNSVLPMSKTEKFLDFVLLLDVTAHFNIFKYFYFME